jgi:hypothetical protein
MRYNLACYACQLGNLKQARKWLEKVIEIAGTNEIKLMALGDPDLEQLESCITTLVEITCLHMHNLTLLCAGLMLL